MRVARRIWVLVEAKEGTGLPAEDGATGAGAPPHPPPIHLLNRLCPTCTPQVTLEEVNSLARCVLAFASDYGHEGAVSCAGRQDC